jgi:hypothetical protein
MTFKTFGISCFCLQIFPRRQLHEKFRRSETDDHRVPVLSGSYWCLHPLSLALISTLCHMQLCGPLSEMAHSRRGVICGPCET